MERDRTRRTNLWQNCDRRMFARQSRFNPYFVRAAPSRPVPSRSTATGSPKMCMPSILRVIYYAVFFIFSIRATWDPLEGGVKMVLMGVR